MIDVVFQYFQTELKQLCGDENFLDALIAVSSMVAH